MLKRVLYLLTISVPVCGWAQSTALPDAPYVSTSASAVEEVAPDFAVLSMQFRTVQEAPDAVRTRTDEAQRRLIDVLDDFEDAIREQRVESMRFGEEFEFDRQRGERIKVGRSGGRWPIHSSASTTVKPPRTGFANRRWSRRASAPVRSPRPAGRGSAACGV